MQKSNFREWTLDKIDESFGLSQVSTLPILEELLAFEYNLDDFEKRYLSILQKNYLNYGGDSWNEVELENKLISPVIVFSEMDSKNFAYFLERELAVTIDDYELSGKVDGMIATGFRSPKKPYFCLNRYAASEYKRGTDPNGDPQGQALIAMLVAQKLNDNQNAALPIFGSYIIGRHWYFMALVGVEYAISTDFSAADEGLFDIYRMLKGLKFQIEKML